MDEAILTIVDWIKTKAITTERLDTALAATQNDRTLFCQYVGSGCMKWTEKQWTE